MVFANSVRLIRQSERILHTKRIGWTLCDYPRILISNNSNAIEMSKPKILITRPDIPVAGLNLLRKRYHLIIWDKPEPIPRVELMVKIYGVDAVFCVLTDKIDNEVLDHAGSQLKVVASMSVGLDHIDISSLQQRNIKIGYTPNVLTESTAELIIALLLATSRNVVHANLAIYKGEWTSWSPVWMCGTGLAGKVVGIVGLGRIGFRVAEILKSFNVAKILYFNRTVKEEASKFDGEKVDFPTLLQNSDFVIVTVALTPQTRYMFNSWAFNQMKKTAIFVNGSRGDVVDQQALIDALQNKTIAAAGVDVTTPEPLPINHELLKLDNCVVLPHIGSATIEARNEMACITAKNIIAVLEGNPEKMPAEYGKVNL
ncbi:PREDICTED: glyoxylate reductase/hydroxypyruvate reductase [Trachymyrmex cornetzi]|uniref:glyoxylate reductase/hydroxypyruvate reductase n=1 Tax=Trachymyrmex cornetzi TaxID=471704 RepID=UPI00084F6A46|nr:PREDICTED: glyoxylate reductase/hydroxypyruvate reductase [Trachymyrmex cornetzi]